MEKKVAKMLFAVAIAAMLVLVGALSYLYMNGGQLPYSGTPNDAVPEADDDTQVNVDLAPDFNYPTIDGGYLSLSGLRGDVVILDFMAIWCQPCGSQMEILNQVYSEYAGRGVTIVSIDVDTSETASELLAYKAQKGASWDFVFDESGISSDPSYDARNIPTLIVIRKDGSIAQRYVGVTSLDTLKAAIEPLL